MSNISNAKRIVDNYFANSTVLHKKATNMNLREFSYIRNKGTKNEWAIKGSPFEEGALKLNELNLIVGQNATGKSRTVAAICDLADLVSGNKNIEQIVYKTAIFDATFEENGMLTSYRLELKDGKVIDEHLNIDGTMKLDRKGRKLYYEAQKDYLPFQTDDNVVAVTRRDRQQQSYMEPLYLWGRNLSYYLFGSSLGQNMLIKDITLNLDEAAKPRVTDKVSGLFVKALGEFKEIRDLVIADMKDIGYNLMDIKSSKPKNVALNAYGISVKEEGLKDYTDQMEMSQGMFRSLSLVIQIEYSLLANLPSCIMIDDIGEGLDYERSQSLIKLIMQKAASSRLQLIMTTNNRFVMNNIDLKYWHVINRENERSVFYNIGNSKDVFEEFSLTGLNNFDFFATKFYKDGMEAFGE